MSDKRNKVNFLSYINNPMSKESIEVLYSANNIKLEKCSLYGDFVQSLLMISFDTYLGDEVTNQEAQLKHFQWCWDKNIENFKLEGINFNSDKLYDYFLQFMIEVFYLYKEKKPFDSTDKGLLKIWADIFNYDKPKSNSDIDTLIEIYSIFEKSMIL